jgi:hypothetical protein
MLIENGANFTAAFDYWQTFHHLRKTENPFPRLWDHFVTKIEYDTPGELVSDLMTGKALGLVRKLRFDWEIPEALKSEPDPTWNGDSLERGNIVNRLQNQFVLVGEKMLNSMELHIHGTQCLSYVLECWGEKGKSILRHIAASLGKLANSSTTGKILLDAQEISDCSTNNVLQITPSNSAMFLQAAASRILSISITINSSSI